MGAGGQAILYPLLFIVAGWTGLWLLKVTAIGLRNGIERLLLPAELRLFQWLQDRAVARTLGADIDVVRFRRKVETADKPFDVPDANGAKRHF